MTGNRKKNVEFKYCYKAKEAVVLPGTLQGVFIFLIYYILSGLWFYLQKKPAKEEQPRLLIPEVENLRLSEVSEKARGDSSVRPPTLTPNASSK
uniref:Uncharacterized protein n=1 Tax=Parascaris equorum TaxID=6256 RepID=A0A914RLI3_PAREQ